MRSSILWFLSLFLCFPLLGRSQNAPVPASPAPAPQAETPGAAGSHSPNSAQLLSVQDITREQVAQTGRASYLGVYPLKLQDGATETTVLYRYGLFQHDYTRQINIGMSIPYRVSGKHMFLMSQDGKEIKTDVCEPKGDKFRCGGALFNVTFKQ